MVLLFEFVTLLILLTGGLFSRGNFRAGNFCESWRCLGWLSERPAFAVLVPGLLTFVGSAAVALLTETPTPCVNDEFSYLLTAETFANGRLVNPSHLLWRHFETFNVIQQPTYVSKHPPAQGLFLALGQVATGYPIVGVWLSAALACAALSWMLRAWLPPRWAVLGAILTAIRLVLHGRVTLVAQNNVTLLAYWTQSYWGGAVSLLGGALLFGALRRLPAGPRVRDAMLLALGVAVLANSRPFEGLVVSLPAATILLAWILGKENRSLRTAFGQVILPIVLILTLTGACMGYYNLRATGNLWRFPYLVHEQTYGAAPLFLWQSLGPLPNYRHAVMRELRLGGERQDFLAQQSLPGWSAFAARKLLGMWYFYLGVFFTVPLATLPSLWRHRWTRVAVVTCSLFTGVLLLETWFFPHYAAPVAPLGLVVVLQGMRRLHLWKWRGRPVGRFLIRPLLLVSLLTLLATFIMERPLAHGGWHLGRARILAELERSGGQHLVLVRYGDGHWPHEEWVYNSADIDAAKVVWAREMAPEDNRNLLDYFRNRHVWLLTSDSKTTVIRAYPGPTDYDR